ncbi:MAG: hypothetical protein HYY40_11585, partial [Bacteroidetes bacterium]|nr:hypothetical protein [Bacteroidota bacterium]
MTTYFSCHEYLPRQIKIPPQKDVNIIIVIPCCCERNLLTALGSLCNCIEPDCSAEVIVVINAASGSSEGILKQNLLTYKHASAWIIKNKKRGIKYFLIAKNDLPERKAGVGLARKIGMDEAARRFCDINKKNGIIVCYDSDCTCDPNLL